MAPFGTSNTGNTQFSALFSYIALTYWAGSLHITLFYRTTGQVRVLWICVNLFVGVMPLLELRILKIHSFPHFSLHVLTHWAEILHMTLFHRATDQVQVSSICINSCESYAPFWNLEYWKYNVQFSALFSYMLWHIGLKFCLRLCFIVLQIKFECRQFCINSCGSYAPFWNFEYWKYTVFPHFSLTCFDILSWNFYIWLCFTVLQIKFKCRQFYINSYESYAPFET